MRGKYKTTILKVITGPTEIEIVCPYCKESTIVDYDDFTSEYGEDPYEWEYIGCPHCEEEIDIEDTEWE